MLTRRRFLAQSTKAAVAIGAGGLLLPRSSFSAEAESLARIRVGILGAPQSGRSTLAAALSHVAAQYFPSPRHSYRDFAEPHVLVHHPVPIRGHDVLVVTERGTHLADFANDHSIRWNFLNGSLPFDTAILVVAANEGPTAQARAQLVYARAAGVRHVAIFINKIDLVDDPGLVELVELEARDLLEAIGFNGNGAPLVAASAREALHHDRADYHRIRVLQKALDALPRSHPLGDLPLLYRITEVSGPHDRPLVSGYLEQGRLTPGQSPRLLYHGHNAHAHIHEVHRQAQVPTTELLNCVISGPREFIHPGAAIVGEHGPGYRIRFTADLYLLSDDQLHTPRHAPVFSGYRPHFAVVGNQHAAIATLRILEGTRIDRGHFGTVAIDLTEPVPLRPHETFRLVEGGQAVAIGRLREIK